MGIYLVIHHRALGRPKSLEILLVERYASTLSRWAQIECDALLIGMELLCPSMPSISLFPSTLNSTVLQRGLSVPQTDQKSHTPATFCGATLWDSSAQVTISLSPGESGHPDLVNGVWVHREANVTLAEGFGPVQCAVIAAFTAECTSSSQSAKGILPTPERLHIEKCQQKAQP